MLSTLDVAQEETDNIFDLDICMIETEDINTTQPTTTTTSTEKTAMQILAGVLQRKRQQQQKKNEQQQQQIQPQQVEQQVFREHHHPITSRLLTTTTSTSPTTTKEEPQEGLSSERGLSLSSLSSCSRRKRRTSSPGRVKEEEEGEGKEEGEKEKEEHPHRSSSTAIVPIRKHQKRNIIVATSSLVLFASSLSSVLASSLPLAIKTVGYINHLHSKVSTISGHIKHLEGHLLSISSWSISNISCSSCWNISSNIKSIFSKMAAAPSTEASQQMDITENEEQQVIEDHQPAEVEAPSSPERAASLSHLKPPINTIKTEKEAKIHIIDTIIYDTMSSDASYHTPPSETISKIYDSFGLIMADGIDLTSMTSDYTLIILVDFMKQAASICGQSTHTMGPVSSDRPHQRVHSA